MGSPCRNPDEELMHTCTSSDNLDLTGRGRIPTMAGGIEPQYDAAATGTDFSVRLVDQFFRRWFWYVLPVLLLALVGVRAANNVGQQFTSSGTLSASENPLVATPQARGTTIGQYEAPATGIARLINEQMLSDAFVDDVAKRAGLGDALTSGIITPDIIRQQVGASAQGQNLLAVQASWSDPKTSFLLVDSTITSYLNLIAETVAIDSEEAIQFWTGVKSDAQKDVDAAQNALDTYTRTLPKLAVGEQLSAGQQLDLNRLNSNLDSALTKVSTAQASIDSATLNAEQAKSQAGRQVRVVDPPRQATAPKPETFKKVATLVMFTMIGLLISFAALVVTTMIDRSIRSLSQLRAAANVGSVASVSKSKAFRDWPRSLGRAA
jgi:hypothetical protein